MVTDPPARVPARNAVRAAGTRRRPRRGDDA
jgi:hypothetical protein